MSDINMRRVLFGNPMERAAEEDRVELLMAVQRQMFCQRSGAVLDVRTAVLVRVTVPTLDSPVLVIMTGEEYDNGGAEQARTICERFEGATVSTVDGRDYTAAGELRASVRKAREAALREQSQPLEDLNNAQPQLPIS